MPPRDQRHQHAFEKRRGIHRHWRFAKFYAQSIAWKTFRIIVCSARITSPSNHHRQRIMK